MEEVSLDNFMAPADAVIGFGSEEIHEGTVEEIIFPILDPEKLKELRDKKELKKQPENI